MQNNGHAVVHDSHCLTCLPQGPFLRNHYFTGKLLVERDFNDEQDYYVGKSRFHNRYLHGSGVVCGLRVRPHPRTECQKRYLCIEPGLALDCCGREIIVRDVAESARQGGCETNCAVLVDLEEFPEFVKLKSEADGLPHRLQIALCYKECGTEDIPVLYDECGCDGSRCAPNRVLESYEVKLLVDQPLAIDSPHAVELKWKSTIGVARAEFIALNDPRSEIYVVTVDPLASQSTIYVFSLGNGALQTSFVVSGLVLSLRASPDGASLYVALQSSTDPGGDRILGVYHAIDFAAVPSTQTLPNTADSDIELATSDAHTERLFVLVSKISPANSRIQVWERTATTTISRESDLAVTMPVTRIAVSSDGNTVYVLNTGSPQSVETIDVSDPANPVVPATLTPRLESTQPTALAVARSTQPDRIVVVATSASRLYLLDSISAADFLGKVDFDAGQEPLDLVVSPGGRWAYILQSNATDCTVRALNLFMLKSGTVEWTAPVAVPNSSERVVLSRDGKRLYVCHAGVPDAGDGGVAILEVSDTDCCELPWRSLEGCSPCNEECVVLATIENYQPDYVLTEPGPGEPTDDDPPADSAWIDNRLGRKLLPSTQTLAEMIECICEQGGNGQVGPQGPPGEDGEDGENGSDGTDGADGADGAPGPAGPGLEEGLVRIDSLSWEHGSLDLNAFVPINVDDDRVVPGLVVGFSEKIKVVSNPYIWMFNHTFELQVSKLDEQDDQGPPWSSVCWCPIILPMIPVTPVRAGSRITSATIATAPSTGLALIANTKQLDHFKRLIVQFRVVVRCDFIVDRNGAAVDGEFARAELSTGDRAAGSIYGNQGGTFESWFTMNAFDRGVFNPGVPWVNEDDEPGITLTPVITRGELMSLEGIGEVRAGRLLQTLSERSIRNSDDLRTVLGMGDTEFTNFMTRNESRIRFV